MKLHYEGHEQITAPYQTVFDFMNSPEKVAACLPDVISTEIADPHHFTSVVRVGVGPVKGEFTFQVALEPKPDEKVVDVTIHGAGMGSVVDLTAHANMNADGAGTTLDWTGEATVSGPVATIGGRILDAQAKRIITHVFTRVRETLSGPERSVATDL